MRFGRSKKKFFFIEMKVTSTLTVHVLRAHADIWVGVERADRQSGEDEILSRSCKIAKVQWTFSPEDEVNQSEVLTSRPGSAELQLTCNEAPRPRAPNSINCVSAPTVFALIYLHNPTVPGGSEQTPEIALAWRRPMFWGRELCVAHQCQSCLTGWDFM